MDSDAESARLVQGHEGLLREYIFTSCREEMPEAEVSPTGGCPLQQRGFADSADPDEVRMF